MSNGEFYNRASMAPSCGYASLASYNANGAAAMAPVISSVPSMSSVVVPTALASYGGYGYSSLSHGQGMPACGGYFGINRAYPTGAACGSFVSRSCS